MEVSLQCSPLFFIFIHLFYSILWPRLPRNCYGKRATVATRQCQMSLMWLRQRGGLVGSQGVLSEQPV